jgi:hypothetical protein
MSDLKDRLESLADDLTRGRLILRADLAARPLQRKRPFVRSIFVAIAACVLVAGLTSALDRDSEDRLQTTNAPTETTTAGPGAVSTSSPTSALAVASPNLRIAYIRARIGGGAELVESLVDGTSAKVVGALPLVDPRASTIGGRASTGLYVNNQGALYLSTGFGLTPVGRFSNIGVAVDEQGVWARDIQEATWTLLDWSGSPRTRLIGRSLHAIPFGSIDGGLALYDGTNRNILVVTAGGERTVGQGLPVAASQQTVTWIDDNRDVRIINIGSGATRTAIRLTQEGLGATFGAAISPNGALLAMPLKSSADYTSTRTLIVSLTSDDTPREYPPTVDVVWSGDGKFLLDRPSPNRVNVVDVTTGETSRWEVPASTQLPVTM